MTVYVCLLESDLQQCGVLLVLLGGGLLGCKVVLLLVSQVVHVGHQQLAGVAFITVLAVFLTQRLLGLVHLDPQQNLLKMIGKAGDAASHLIKINGLKNGFGLKALYNSVAQADIVAGKFESAIGKFETLPPEVQAAGKSWYDGVGRAQNKVVK